MKSDRERCQRVKKRMYLPDVDEYNSSSEPLTGKEKGKQRALVEVHNSE